MNRHQSRKRGNALKKLKLFNECNWVLIFSPSQDSSEFTSHGTLIICPASLIHHWKNEVEKHVSHNRLRVCLYHGPNRNQHAKV